MLHTAMNIAARDSTLQPAYLDKLNSEQRRAVEHGAGHIGGPLLIIAGAGAGKTNTLAHRVAHLLLQGVPPERILLLTFTRRAAQEMLRRAERIAIQVLSSSARDASRQGNVHINAARL